MKRARLAAPSSSTGGGGGGVALPLLSVRDCGVPLKLSAAAAVECARTFLLASLDHRELRVVLVVDSAEQEEAASDAAQMAAGPEPQHAGAGAAVGGGQLVDVVLNSKYVEGAIAAGVDYAVCPVSWQMSKGCKICRNVHGTLGPRVAERGKELYGGVAMVGKAYPIGEPYSHPFKGIIILRGPNMNPAKPDSMDLQPALDCLRTSYSAALECAWSLFRKEAASSSKREEENQRQGPQSDAFPAYGHPNVPPPASSGAGHWKQILRQYLSEGRNPALEPWIYYEDESAVVIYDAFPKAKLHLLLLSKPLATVAGVAELRAAHAGELNQLHSLGKQICESLEGSPDITLPLRMGYHALPSLEPLHLHIISSDMDSASLKTKKHWNSFTTSFFLSTSLIERHIAEHGRVVIDFLECQSLEKGPMHCLHCGAPLSNMPGVKEHIGQQCFLRTEHYS
jgi:aprataxin